MEQSYQDDLNHGHKAKDILIKVIVRDEVLLIIITKYIQASLKYFPSFHVLYYRSLSFTELSDGISIIPLIFLFHWNEYIHTE